MKVIRSVVKKSIWVSALVLAALSLVVLEVLADPTSFQWQSYNGQGSPDYGVYEDPTFSTVLEPGDLVQLIWVGADGEIDPPDASGDPTDDDELLDTSAILVDGPPNPPPVQHRGYFQKLFSYDTNDWPNGSLVYVRAWNDSSAGSAALYGNSSTTTLSAGSAFNFPRWYTDAEAGGTAVTLASFTATCTGNAISVTWRTATQALMVVVGVMLGGIVALGLLKLWGRRRTT